ncbi:hypothetical protein MNBD_GAMMA10-1234 [hydrothermal vent metagenome]|uniref:Uncharacterized protein n=1 Tax=hydrothermal vent metagenome TaxID=652676 RepID=A0A3B0XBI9_9ZZZZ
MGSGVEAACVEFMENFVAHLEIEYSPDAQRDRKKAQAENPEAQYSPTRPPQAWELYDRKPFLCQGGARGIKEELHRIRNYPVFDLMWYFEMFDDPVEDVIWEPKVLSEHPLEEVNGKLDPEYMLRLQLMRRYYYHSVDYSIRNIEAYSASHLPSAPIEDQPKSVVDIYHQHTAPWPDDLVAQYEECLALQDELDAKREAEASEKGK